MRSRPNARWVTLLICLCASTLVVHLTHRFDRPPFVQHSTVGCGCPQATWQQLDRDGLDTDVAPPQVWLADFQIVGIVERPEEVQLPQVLPDESLYSRPPPSC